MSTPNRILPWLVPIGILCLICVPAHGRPAKTEPPPSLIIIHPKDPDKRTLYQEIRTNVEEQQRLQPQASVLDLQQALEPFGYYRSRFEKYPSSDPAYSAVINIFLGPQLIIQSIDFSLQGPGASDPRLSTVLSSFRPQKGQALYQQIYEESKVDILNTVIRAGYPLAYYSSHVLRIDLEKNQAHIHLILDTGAFYTMGPVHFEHPFFDRSLLQRFISFTPQTPYHISALADAEHRLNSSPYFKNVQLSPQFNAAHKAVPINVHMELEKPNQYISGFGYGTDTGLRARLEWERRYLNRFGHSANLQYGLAQRQQKTEATYRIPGEDPVSDRTEAKIEHLRETFHLWDSRATEYSLIFFSRVHSWERSFSMSLYDEADRAPNGVFLRQNSLWIPRVNFLKLKRDHPFNPSHGYKIAWSVMGIMEKLNDHRSFVQNNLVLKRLFEASEYTHFLTRLELGATFPNRVEDLPVLLRYFAGGDNSIRGFSYKSVFSSQANGTDGGSYLMAGSLEWIQKIHGRWSIAFFTDAGGAPSLLPHPHRWMVSSIGTGLRVSTPVGPLRFEVARPMHHPLNYPHSIRYHIVFGPEL